LLGAVAKVLTMRCFSMGWLTYLNHWISLMSKKYEGIPHQGAGRNAPYPLSRLAPAIELVDLAREIAQADTLLSTVANAKLQTLATQMRALQDEARQILAHTHRDQVLHRIPCAFKRLPGKIYHVYAKDMDDLYFSMLAPQEWQAPHQFVGSYRLEADMSWTPLQEADSDFAEAIFTTRTISA
jgi:hypothetical protein